MHQSLGELSWVGLYLTTPTRLILGPFQGAPAYEKIAFGKGVVGECFDKKETITVFAVAKRPNDIRCDASARSKIRIYLTREGMPFGVFDIGLPYVHDYSKEEIKIFEKIAENSSVSVKKSRVLHEKSEIADFFTLSVLFTYRIAAPTPMATRIEPIVPNTAPMMPRT
ncbi:MAG: hypothetical protein J6A47_05095 [Bacilli bacterium]|nr:hypothetical protein [Bacilli bacterium]